MGHVKRYISDISESNSGLNIVVFYFTAVRMYVRVCLFCSLSMGFLLPWSSVGEWVWHCLILHPVVIKIRGRVDWHVDAAKRELSKKLHENSPWFQVTINSVWSEKDLACSTSCLCHCSWIGYSVDVCNFLLCNRQYIIIVLYERR